MASGVDPAAPKGSRNQLAQLSAGVFLLPKLNQPFTVS